MKSNTAGTSGSYKAVSLADKLVSVEPIQGPVALSWALRKLYSTEEEWAKQKKEWHMEEIKNAGNDYEI